jgi:serine/threonine protein kinase
MKDDLSTFAVPGTDTHPDLGSDSDFHDPLLEKVVLVSGFRPVRTQVTLQRGDHIGGDNGRRFEILDELGRGAMGVVFAARDTVLERTTAIKLILHREARHDAELVALLHLEARTAARLDHENLIRVFDLGTWNGVPFLVMEYLEGQPLDALLCEHLSSLRATRVMAQIAAGLAHAHEHGVVHRDLNPSNVFVLKSDRVKVLDFGLARTTASGHETPFPISGTPPYMAPEQWLGRVQDARTDVWAAGVMLFELLTGCRPYREQDPAALRARVTSLEPAPLPRCLRPELPAEADRIVARAMQKDPQMRFQSATELRGALLEFESRSNDARTGRPATDRAIRPCERSAYVRPRGADRNGRPLPVTRTFSNRGTTRR